MSQAKKILIVEDDYVMAKTMRGEFEDDGYDVSVALMDITP